MLKRICKINEQYEFEFDFFGERINFNEELGKHEPVVYFQTHIEETTTGFVANLFPLIDTLIYSIEIIDPNDGISFFLSKDYDMLKDVNTDFPMFDEKYYRGNVLIGCSKYSTTTAQDDLLYTNAVTAAAQIAAMKAESSLNTEEE